MKRGKVLLVDDNTDMELIGERIFRRAGFDYISARNGQEGLETARSDRPDVIVLDYMLPDMNGAQFLRFMSTEPDYASIRRIPVVILTARTDMIDDLEECFSMGLRAFLNKPFGHRELVNIIESILHVEQAAVKVAVQAQPAGPGLEEQWVEDVQMVAHTIARLTGELQQDSQYLADPLRIDIQAIYIGSKRLLTLLERLS